MKKINYCLLYMGITFSSHYSFAATTVWTDSDFNTPKGHTWINPGNPSYGGDVHIKNTNKVQFYGSPPGTTGLLSIESGGKLVADGLVESTNTGTGDAVLVLGGSKAYFDGGLIATNANPSNGYFTVGVTGSGSELHVKNDTTINGARGLALLGSSTNSFDGKVTINSTIRGLAVESSNNIFKEDVDITVLGDNGSGMAISGNSSTTKIEGPLSITMQGNNSVGIIGDTISSGTANLTVDGPLSINMAATSNNTSSIYGVVANANENFHFKDTSIIFDDTYTSKRQYGLYASAGNIDVDGKLTIKISNADSDYAIYAANSGTVSTSGLSDITGRIYATSNANVFLDMAANSNWEGSARANNGTIDLTMLSSLWNMTSTSNITNLEANNTHINFLSTPTNFFTLTTQSLTGNNSVFAMNVDLGSITSPLNSNNERVGIAGTNGDLLVITNTVGNGKQYLTINNNGSLATQGNEVLQVVSTPTNNTGDFSLTSAVEVGGYEYGLRQAKDATNQAIGWELYGKGKYSSSTESTLSYFHVGYLLNYIDTQTLLQRMGDLREDSKHDRGGFWIRGYAGKANSFSGQNLSGFSMNYAGTQLGIDKQIEISSAVLYSGIMVDYTKADNDHKQGSNTAKNLTLGLYTTYLHDNGIYVDGIIKYSNIRNHFSVKDTQNQNVKGKSQTDGFGLSLETGKRFAIGNSNFYIEPQLQLSYQHQTADKSSSSNGLNIELGSYDSLLGRASTIVGYKLFENKNSQVHIYAKTGVVKEFLGDTHYTINSSNKQRYDFNGHWIDSGVGISSQLNDKHYIYGEVDYASGSRFDKAQLMLGYRYQF